MSDSQSELQPVRHGAEHGGIGRRRLLRAGLVAAPVVLTVSGRSAMAAACPPGLSGPTMTSLNPSGDGVNCIASSHAHTASSSRLGLSPGYWKPNPEGQTFQPPYPWPIAPFKNIEAQGRNTTLKSGGTGVQNYSWNPNEYLQYRDIPQDATGWDTGTKYNAIFTSAYRRLSFSRILLEENGSLEWHFCAAYLNAAAMPGTYVLSIQEVLEIASTGCIVPGGHHLTDGQIKAFLSQTWS
ncbi:hypothetical protein [Rhodoferax sp.]|uniref:hypothetical protein n=1 Tax=Rhodoferax sp. TaxID=50421 RepID=UPI00374C8A5A